MPPSNRPDRSTSTTGLGWVSISRNLDDPFRTSTSYASCPVHGFAMFFSDERGYWSLCGHLGSPRRPIDAFDVRVRMTALRGAA